MNSALDDFNNRIEPYPKGKGNCKVCGSVLIAHCGELNMWHWQHLSGDRECDPWKEHETPWHREWKNQFPKEWQEKVIVQNSEKHLADVRTINGVVIEFQNSPISPATIRIREEFYGNMVWVVNAVEFKDRLVMRSLVKQELKTVHIKIMNEAEKFERAYDKKIGILDDELLEIPSKIWAKKEEVKSIKERLLGVANHNNNPNRLVDHMVEVWAKRTNPYREPLVQKILDSYKDTTLPTDICNDFEQIKIQENRIVTIGRILKQIDALETIEINNSVMRIIDFSYVRIDNYRKIVMVEKDTKKSLFPITSTIKTEMEFQNLKFKASQFDFAIDPKETIERLEKEREELIQANKKGFERISAYKERLQKEFKEGLNKLKDEWEKNKEELISKINKEEASLNDLKSSRNQLMNSRISAFKVGRENIEAQHSGEQGEIMKEFKGLYDFQWKNERKSWKSSSRSIYLDTGDTLFEIIDGDTLKKLSKEQFLLKYR